MINASRRITLKKNYTLTIFVIILFLSFVFVNIGSGLLTSRHKADFTSNAQYTLSSASRQIISEISSPLYIRLYLSSTISRDYPALYQYSQTVLRRLESYRNQNPEMIKIEIRDPEPYSKTAKEAENQGLKSFLSADGQNELYFGAVLGNDNGDIRLIEQFSPGRNNYLENDISRTIASLNNPLRSKIGILSENLPISQKTYGSKEHYEWAFLRLLRNQYDIAEISPNTVEIPYDIETLLLINPTHFHPLFAYALDQYLLRGGRVILFADPYSEIAAELYSATPNNNSNINKILKSWGASIDFNKVIGDRNLGENIINITDNGEQLQNRPERITLNTSLINQDSSFTKNLTAIRLHSSGSIELQKIDNIKITTLFKTTKNGGSFNNEDLKFLNHQEVLEQYSEDKQQYTLAALVEGRTDSSYLHNPLDGTGFEKEMLPFLPTSIKEGKLLIIADSDILDDSLWVNEEVSGTTGVFELISYAQNGEFILRAVDYMTGAGEVSALGSRQLHSKTHNISQTIYRHKLQPYLSEYRQTKQLLTEKEQLVKIWNEAVQKNETNVNMSIIKQLEQNRKEIEELREKLKKIEYMVRKETARETDIIIWTNMVVIPSILLFAIWLLCFICAKRRNRKVREIVHEYKIS